MPDDQDRGAGEQQRGPGGKWLKKEAGQASPGSSHSREVGRRLQASPAHSKVQGEVRIAVLEPAKPYSGPGPRAADPRAPAGMRVVTEIRVDWVATDAAGKVVGYEAKPPSQKPTGGQRVGLERAGRYGGVVVTSTRRDYPPGTRIWVEVVTPDNIDRVLPAEQSRAERPTTPRPAAPARATPAGIKRKVAQEGRKARATGRGRGGGGRNLPSIIADQLIGDMVARITEPASRFLFGYRPKEDPIAKEILRRIEALQPQIEAELTARSEEVLALASRGAVFALPTIHYRIGTAQAWNVGSNVEPGQPLVEYLSLEHVGLSSSPREEACGNLLTRGWSLRTLRSTDVVAGTWCRWSIEVDTSSFREELEAPAHGSWLEVYEDKGREHAWARFDVHLAEGQVSVAGATVSPTTLRVWSSLKIRDEVWDPETKKLAFIVEMEGRDLAGDPTRSIFYYNLAQVGQSTLRGKVLILRSYDPGSEPEVRDVTFRRIPQVGGVVAMAAQFLGSMFLPGR